MRIEENISLKEKTLLKVGGPATYFACVRNNDELREALAFARERALAVRVLGGGSNVLVPDKGFDGLVIHPLYTEMEYKEDGGSVYATVGAGVELDTLVGDVMTRQLWGLENLSGIPGSVGAVPIQNVGAYGVEAKDVVHSLTAYNMDTDTIRTFTHDECRFGYRDSYFKTDEGKRYVITDVTFRLTKTSSPKIEYKDLALAFEGSPNPSLEEIRNAVIRIRSKKFPDWHTVGTAGSFFKNPIISVNQFEELKQRYPEIKGFPHEGSIKVALGWVLDHILQVKGYRKGNVGLYEGQALVLVNYGGATADEVCALSDEISKKVFDACGILIEREVVTFA